ncbi:hypothetical protein [Vibrio coralliilyticus]|uniref:hypothetical protein n=1 Tax=Vibrio coralliilyticus TaxID=190893 RepID=UPI002FD38335
MIYSLKKTIKNFAWENRAAILEYFGIDNSTCEHQAEVWIGTHPTASPRISQSGIEASLCDAISDNPNCWLGESVVLPASSGEYHISWKGYIARIYC